MKIKLIIFDLDGTLVDTATDITNALNYAIEPYLREKLTVTHTVSLIGEGLTRLVEKVLGDTMAAVKPQVLERFIQYYSEHLTDFSVPYPGVRDTLSDLAEYRKVIVSNKRESLSKKVLEDLALAQFFDAILGSDSVKEKKPSPQPLHQVMDMFSCRPAETVIIGDSSYDIDAGRAAGAITIAVSYGYNDPNMLRHADFVIDTFAELKEKLGELNTRQRPMP